MTPEREKSLLSSLYDRLFDAITYTPEGKQNAFNKTEIYFQMAKNQVLNPDEFKDMASPSNPEGDLSTAAAFSEFVDRIPAPNPLWGDSNNKVSDQYEKVIAQAVCGTEPNPEQLAQYREAYNFLNTEREVKVVGGTRKNTMPSDSAIAYDDAQGEYITAVSGFRTAYNGYDLTKKDDQRQWNAVAPGLQLNITKAWNGWGRAGKEEVEEAQKILSSTINDALRTVIEDSRKRVSPAYKMAPIGPYSRGWLPSYASPSNWCTDLKGSKLKFTSNYLNKSESSSSHTYAADFSARWGLWHGSGGVEGEHSNSQSAIKAENLTLEAELILVSIMRPWYNPLILSMKDWWVTGFKKNGISDGNLNGQLALVPTAFVVAKDVTITADFSEEDKKVVKNMVNTKAEGGWGPFSVSGKYGHKSSQEDFSSKFDGSSLKLPGFQVVAWINSITPPSPPSDAK
jgi:hypothetical protein